VFKAVRLPGAGRRLYAWWHNNGLQRKVGALPRDAHPGMWCCQRDRLDAGLSIEGTFAQIAKRSIGDGLSCALITNGFAVFSKPLEIDHYCEGNRTGLQQPASKASYRRFPAPARAHLVPGLTRPNHRTRAPASTEKHTWIATCSLPHVTVVAPVPCRQMKHIPMQEMSETNGLRPINSIAFCSGGTASLFRGVSKPCT